MKTPTRLLFASALFTAGTSVAMAERLEITGKLEATTCKVQAASGTVSVQMGTVDLASINTDTRAGQKNFSINLDCTGSSAAQIVAVRFGGAEDGSTGNLALTSASTAKNVGVALYDAKGVHQKLGDEPTTSVTIQTNAKGKLDYSAWYASPGRNATAGTADATGNFVVLYK